MIDVQIVSGRDPAFVAEAVGRVQQQDGVSQILVAVNHSHSLNVEANQTIRNESALSFEQNHNRLAKLGNNPFILFLDDDAFVFPGGVETMLEAIQNDKSLAAVGALNNQIAPMNFQGKQMPQLATLAEFKSLQASATSIAQGMHRRFGTQTQPKIFLPGCCLLVRRKVWQREYGGWDEDYCNWNEEVDFNLWCNERGYTTAAAPGAWIFHCQGRSRSPEQLLDNIVHSARHFRAKWPKERLARLAAQKPALRTEINALFELNEGNSDPEKVRHGVYYRTVSGALPS